MATIATLAVNLIAKTSVFDKKMRNSKKSLKGFTADIARTQKQMLNLAKMAIYAAGAYGLGRLGKSLIDTASMAEETQAKFDTVFKNLSTEANEWAESFGNSVGRARQDVKKWMAGLQDTFVPLGIAREESFKLSKSLTKLAVDVASFNNTADSDVIRDFTSALVGNHETVRKFGIIISESALKQEAMAKGIDKNYKELTDLEKVQLRYSLIMKGTTDAQDDAIRTAGSYANQVKRLKANITNLQETMGSAILPAFTEAVTQLNAEFIKISENSEELGDTTLDVFEDMAMGAAYFADGIIVITNSVKGLIGVFTLWMVPVADFFAWIGKVPKEFADELALSADKMLNEIADAVEKLPTEKVKEFFSDIRTNIKTTKDDAEKLTEELVKGVMFAPHSDWTGITPQTEGWDKLTTKMQMAIQLWQEKHKTEKTDIVDTTSNIQEMLNALDFEYSMLGKINEVRERAIELAKFRNILEKEYPNDLEKQNELMEEYAAKLERNAAGLQGFVAFQRKITEYGEQATNVWANLGDIGAHALDGMSDALTQMVLTGKADFKSLTSSILQDIMQMMIKMMLFRTLFGAANPEGEYSGGLFSGLLNAKSMHSGGIAGLTSSLQTVPIGIFAGAPRLHNGLAADEFPAILQRGEKVTSRVDVAREDKSAVQPMQPNINVKIVNVTDKRQTLDAMNGSEGEKVILNAIKRNKGIVGGMLR